MDESPGTSLRRRTSASLVVAARLVKDGKAQALVSAGNTGALHQIALLEVGRLKGIRRPALAAIDDNQVVDRRIAVRVAALALLQHPESMDRLRAEPELWDSAVEEIVRYRGPIHSSKPQYATCDVEWHGVTIPKGTAVFPLYGAANHDPRFFDDPEVFDIAREPNKHLGFGWGPHFCLGASLARMETRITLQALFERNPNLRLAVPEQELRLVRAPGWHRYEKLPVILK